MKHKIYFLPAITIIALTAQSAHAGDFLSYSGEQLYQRFCSGCHGISAHGDGRIAKSLGVIVPDLTLLTQQNHGVFPQERIIKIIDGRITIGKHNNDRTMPVWGEELLRSETGDPEAEQQTADLIHKIVDYLSTIQAGTENKSSK
ncbi:MAG: c-type cytochrome [Steroidobacter sp.]